MNTGTLAEFESPKELTRALDTLYERGYRFLDAFTPYPVPEATKILRLTRSRLGLALFPVGVAGAGFGYLVQWFCNAYDYPLNVGGRPLNSAPAFIPITFETFVLATSVVGFVSYLVITGLPRLYAPIFDVPGFNRASIDRFWIGIDDRDPGYDEAELERLLRDLGALSVRRARST